MLAVEALEVELARRSVVRGVTARIGAGSLTGIIGPNGAGKSTLVRAMLGLVPASSGRVTIDGTDLRRMKPAKAARTIAYLAQGQAVHWPVTVERLVALGRLPHLAPFSTIGAEDAAAIDRAIVRADLARLRHRVVNELSGGERARALLARALATEAPALIVDEPLAALDPGHQLDVMTLLANQARGGMLVVAVLHDLGIAARFCDRLLLLDGGTLVADGKPGSVLTPELLASAYGIRAWSGVVEQMPVLVPLSRSSAAGHLPDLPDELAPKLHP